MISTIRLGAERYSDVVRSLRSFPGSFWRGLIFFSTGRRNPTKHSSYHAQEDDFIPYYLPTILPAGHTRDYYTSHAIHRTFSYDSSTSPLGSPSTGDMHKRPEFPVPVTVDWKPSFPITPEYTNYPHSFPTPTVPNLLNQPPLPHNPRPYPLPPGAGHYIYP